MSVNRNKVTTAIDPFTAPIKFSRVANLEGDHPKGIAGIGIHALSTNASMTLREIMLEHHKYGISFEDYIVPSYGELIRDIGLMICFGMVEVEL